jgi:hypothetical protein
MGKIWREYGVIAVLLVVSVGGYLLLSRDDGDLLTSAMDRIAEHLVSLVPDAEGKELTEASLADFRARVADQEVAPEQLERFAASVLNLHSAGGELNSDEAEMIIRLALNDDSGFSEAAATTEGVASEVASPASGVASATSGVASATSEIAALPTPARSGEMDRVGRRMDRVVRFYSGVRKVAPADTAVRNAPPIQFQADGGLRIVMDDRLRSRMEGLETETVRGDLEMVEWKAHLAETLREQRRHQWDEAQGLRHIAEMAGDSLVSHGALRTLTMLRQLESRGVITRPAVESLAVALELRLSQEMQDLSMQFGNAAAAAVAKGLGKAVRVIANPPNPPSSN